MLGSAVWPTRQVSEGTLKVAVVAPERFENISKSVYEISSQCRLAKTERPFS